MGAYAAGFRQIGIMWADHHVLFRVVAPGRPTAATTCCYSTLVAFLCLIRMRRKGNSSNVLVGHDGGVVVELLKVSRIAELRAQDLTYPVVQRPIAVPPPGYTHFSRAHRLADPADFAAAGQALMTWQVQARSGLQILASSLQVEIGAVIVMRLGVGAVGLSIPCRVVSVVDKPDMRGFSYGSLPGHPESSEELSSSSALEMV